MLLAPLLLLAALCIEIVVLLSPVACDGTGVLDGALLLGVPVLFAVGVVAWVFVRPTWPPVVLTVIAATDVVFFVPAFLRFGMCFS